MSVKIIPSVAPSYTLLTGLSVNESVRINDHIFLIPIPTIEMDLPKFIPKKNDYWDPNKARGHTVWYRSNLPDKNLTDEEFCQALSLATASPVVDTAGWAFEDNDPSLGLVAMWQNAEGTYLPAGSPTNGAIIAEALEILDRRSRLSDQDSKRLQVSLVRWLRSMTSRSTTDAFIDLGIAFEALFLNDGEQSELSFRLALYAAWFLGKDSVSRKDLVRNMRTIYGHRSDAVHRGTTKVTATFMKSEAQEICRQSILKVLKNGKFPDWSELIVGG